MSTRANEEETSGGCLRRLRGRSLAAADPFLWLYRDSPVWGKKHRQIKPVLIGLEHLRSRKRACWSERLTDNAVEDIFWNNAADNALARGQDIAADQEHVARRWRPARRDCQPHPHEYHAEEMKHPKI